MYKNVFYFVVGPAEYYKTEDGRYACLKCPSSYKRKNDLSRHRKFECDIRRYFQCANCLRKFSRKYDLKVHIVAKSCLNGRKKKCNVGPSDYYKTEDGRYGCLKCGSSYKVKCSLGRHTKYECGTQAEFQCAACLKKFRRKSNLKTHAKTCHKRRNII